MTKKFPFLGPPPSPALDEEGVIVVYHCLFPINQGSKPVSLVFDGISHSQFGSLFVEMAHSQRLLQGAPKGITPDVMSNGPGRHMVIKMGLPPEKTSAIGKPFYLRGFGMNDRELEDLIEAVMAGTRGIFDMVAQDA